MLKRVLFVWVQHILRRRDKMPNDPIMILIIVVLVVAFIFSTIKAYNEFPDDKD